MHHETVASPVPETHFSSGVDTLEQVLGLTIAQPPATWSNTFVDRFRLQMQLARADGKGRLFSFVDALRPKRLHWPVIGGYISGNILLASTDDRETLYHELGHAWVHEIAPDLVNYAQNSLYWWDGSLRRSRQASAEQSVVSHTVGEGIASFIALETIARLQAGWRSVPHNRVYSVGLEGDAVLRMENALKWRFALTLLADRVYIMNTPNDSMEGIADFIFRLMEPMRRLSPYIAGIEFVYQAMNRLLIGETTIVQGLTVIAQNPPTTLRGLRDVGYYIENQAQR